MKTELELLRDEITELRREIAALRGAVSYQPNVAPGRYPIFDPPMPPLPYPASPCRWSVVPYNTSHT